MTIKQLRPPKLLMLITIIYSSMTSPSGRTSPISFWQSWNSNDEFSTSSFVFIPITTRKISNVYLLNKLISQFIWQHYRPRIKFNIFYLPKDKGGLALPNFKFYYWAAQLVAIVTWIRGNEEAKRIQIEQAENKLFALPFMDPKHENKLKIGNEWVKQSVKVWTEVKKKKTFNRSRINLSSYAHSR